MEYIETSAKSSHGVDDAFNNLINKALIKENNYKLDLPNHIKITKDQKPGNQISAPDSLGKRMTKKKKCC